MTRDRYLLFVLTVIALELLWLAAAGRPVAASAQAETIPVVIRGIRLDAGDGGVLPVDVRGIVTIEPKGPLKVEADRPLPVEAVPYTPGARPGD